MTQRTELEGVMVGHWTFREVLDRLLLIVVLPVRQILVKVSCTPCSLLHLGKTHGQ